MADLNHLKEILTRLSSTTDKPNPELVPVLQDILDKLKYGNSVSSDLPRSIRGYDEYITAKLDPFVAAANKLGGDAQEGGALVKACWNELREFLLKAASCKEPPQAEITKLFLPISTKAQGLGGLTKRNEWENHMKTLSEGVGALNWVMVKPAPRDFIENFVGGSDFWANKIRKEFRTTNPDHCVFVDSFKALLLGLMEYVKEYHTTGISWDANGKNVSEYSGSSSAVAPVVATSASASAAPVANIFAELKPDSATAGLKTVTKDMQTWRSEYKGGDKPAPVAAAPKSAPAAAAPQVKGPPKLEYQNAGKKWVVENQTSHCEVPINDMKETVYIFGCAGATIDVKGKCKSIIVDSCKKVNIHFDNVMASLEVVNSQRINTVCRESVASVAIDKTDGIVVTLPTSSLDTKIVASKSSEMNVSWPDKDGEMVEKPIPEQYVHHINATRTGVTAEVSDLYA